MGHYKDRCPSKGRQAVPPFGGRPGAPNPNPNPNPAPTLVTPARRLQRNFGVRGVTATSRKRTRSGGEYDTSVQSGTPKAARG